MKTSRRAFLKGSVAATAAAGLLPALAKAADSAPNPDRLAVLVDLEQCIGCRRCEAACQQVNGLPAPERPFADLKVIETPRRMDAKAYTIVNQVKAESKTVNVKLQCMHCHDPACVSACIVGALTHDAHGAVVYDAYKCLGCRYCMVACPFGVPAYEYFNATTPQVRKCTFCAPRLAQGLVPGCVQACPKEALIFGRYDEILALAKERIKGTGSEFRPHDPYVPRIYGETEVGGTSWLYISSVPFEKLGFLSLPDQAPPRLTEAIQHGVFKHALPPLALFTLLGAAMHVFKNRRDKLSQHDSAPKDDEKEARHE